MNEPLNDRLSSELLRKAVHAGFGFCALLMRWLNTAETAALAVAALLFNAFILPHVGGRLIARDRKGHDIGILLYPAVVLLMVVLFARVPAAAALVWSMLAFGDGFATVGGKLIRGPSLPWNRSKSWSGLLSFCTFASIAGYAISYFVGAPSTAVPWIWIVALVTIVCALTESAPLNVDDNLSVPFAGAIVIVLLMSVSRVPAITPDRSTLIWLVVNLLLAGAGLLARSVSVSGFVAGLLLGATLILFGGWSFYLVLLTFFIVGTVTTKLGYRRKAALGIAQERGGRRGASHALANVGVAAACVVVARFASDDVALLYRIAAVASLATAAADTVASEIGQWLGKRTFLPVTLRAVPPGTEGAISIEGTVAGWVGAFIVAVVALAAGAIAGWSSVAIVVAAAAMGSYTESLVGNWNRNRPHSVPNGALNFFNTIVGAGVAAAIVQLVR